MIVAFAYSEALPELAATYYALAEGLVANVREVMPGTQIVQICDDKTSSVKGINGRLTVDRDMKLMPWRLKCHQMIHGIDPEVILVEPDVRFREDVRGVFDNKDFDVAITEREIQVEWQGEQLSDIAPYTMGCTFSRNQDFWRMAKLHCGTLPERQQLWIGDMISLAYAANSGDFKIKMLSGPEYNHVPSNAEDLSGKVLHYKGQRKNWLFPQVSESMEAA